MKIKNRILQFITLCLLLWGAVLIFFTSYAPSRKSWIIVWLIGIGIVLLLYKKIPIEYVDKRTELKYWLLSGGMIAVLSSIRYFYRLMSKPYFWMDEFGSMESAVGLLKTGGRYRWDYLTNDIQDYYGVSERFHEILLAGVYKIFGVSEFSGRALSAVCGIIFMLSLLYIMYKAFHRLDMAWAACLLALANDNLTDIFRTTRMYASLMVTAIWMMFFIYKALNEKNNFKGRYCLKLQLFIKKYFDFHFGYAALALLFTALSLATHPVSAVILGGIFLYIIYLAFAKREIKYFVVIGMGVVVVVLIILTMLGMIPFGIPVVQTFAANLYNHILGKIGKNINWDYMRDMLLSGINYVLTLMAWFIVLCSFLRSKSVAYKSKIAYLICIQLVTVAFFVFCSYRYYAARYMSFLWVVSIIICAVGFGILLIGDKIWKIALWGIMLFGIVIQLRVTYSVLYTKADYYSDTDSAQYVEAYEEMHEATVDMEVVPIYHFGCRGYYFTEIFDNYIEYRMDREADAERFISFAKQQHEGLASVEYIRLNTITPAMQGIITDWTDRVTGIELDDYYIESSRYYALPVVKSMDTVSTDNEILSYSLDDNLLTIELTVDETMKSAQLVCTKFYLDINGGEREKNFQLLLPEYQDPKTYRYQVDLKEKVSNIENYPQIALCEGENALRIIDIE